jgi:hypothetical protein
MPNGISLAALGFAEQGQVVVRILKGWIAQDGLSIGLFRRGDPPPLF